MKWQRAHGRYYYENEKYLGLRVAWVGRHAHTTGWRAVTFASIRDPEPPVSFRTLREAKAWVEKAVAKVKRGKRK